MFSVPAFPAAVTVDKAHFQECLLEMLGDMFGGQCISKLIKGGQISVTIDNKKAVVNLNTLVSVHIYVGEPILAHWFIFQSAVCISVLLRTGSIKLAL